MTNRKGQAHGSPHPRPDRARRSHRGLCRRAARRGASGPRCAQRNRRPAVYRVDELWEKNCISVAQENLATAIVQDLLVLAYTEAERSPGIGRRGLFACVRGNTHALGLRMVADAIDLAGWDIQHLGSDRPLFARLSQVDASRPELLVLSALLVEHVQTLKDTIDARHGEFGQDRPAIEVRKIHHGTCCRPRLPPQPRDGEGPFIREGFP